MSERTKSLMIIWGPADRHDLGWRSLCRDMLLTIDEPRITAPRGNLAEFEQASTDLFDATAPTVAYIFTETASTSALSASPPKGGAGSGFVWDRAGHVVTNFHVVQGADRIAVRLDSGEAIPATLVGVAPDYDLAVLKLRTSPAGLKSIPVGSSADLKVGQAVFAIGNPLGSVALFLQA